MTGLDTLSGLEHVRQWVGREALVHDSLPSFPTSALAAALDRHDAASVGDPLPPARHWLHFLETPQASATGQDGHPRLGGFLPPLPLPRRMWAGGRFEILSPLVIGREAMRKTTIRSVEAKSGKTGALVFVTLDHELSQRGHLCIREEQHLVYREMPTAPQPLPVGQPSPDNARFSRSLHPDPILLFRYSALTYNGHRIHYDRSYAMQQEFYPGLVVHAPLVATLLLDLLRDEFPAVQVRSFSFRALRPCFDATTLTLNGIRKGAEVSLWSADAECQTCLTATAGIV